MSRSRAQHEVERIAEDDCGAEPFELFRRHRLYASVGAHGHEGRVSITPCAAVRRLEASGTVRPQ